MHSRWLTWTLCSLLAACSPAASGSNDVFDTPPAGNDTEPPADTPGSGGDPQDDPDPGSDPGTDPGGEPTPTPEPDAGPGGGDPISLAGRFEGCNSYGAEANGMCAGYYCNVTEEEILAAFTPGLGPCSMNADIAGTVRRSCSGSLTTRVGRCAREVKSANVFDSDEQLRVKIQACIYEEPEFAEVPTECVSCFLDAAQCASDNCLIQCLAGDSAACDSCRLENNCNQPVPTCGGLPSPF